MYGAAQWPTQTPVIVGGPGVTKFGSGKPCRPRLRGTMSEESAYSRYSLKEVLVSAGFWYPAVFVASMPTMETRTDWMSERTLRSPKLPAPTPFAAFGSYWPSPPMAPVPEVATVPPPALRVWVMLVGVGVVGSCRTCWP